MADQAAPISIDRSRAQRCQIRHRREIRRLSEPAETDRLAPVQSSMRPASRRRSRQDAEIVGGEVSSCLFYEIVRSRIGNYEMSRVSLRLDVGRANHPGPPLGVIRD